MRARLTALALVAIVGLHVWTGQVVRGSTACAWVGCPCRGTR